MGLGPLVDAAAGIVVVMALFSLAATALQEAVAEVLKMRPKSLEDGVRALLRSRHLSKILDGRGPADEEAALKAFYDRPEIASLSDGRRRPSAIPPRRYAEAVLSLIGERERLAAQAKDAIGEVGETAERVARIFSEEATERVDAVARGAGEAVQRVADEFDAAIAALETEFDETMDRVSGWYGRRTRLSLFVIGLFLAVGANVDFLGYAQRLMAEAQLQERAQSYAAMVSALGPDEELARVARAGRDLTTVEEVGAQDLGRLVAELDGLGVAVGWTCIPKSTPGRRDGFTPPFGYCGKNEVLEIPSGSMLIGWLLIAFGVTLGANFWFDLLRKAVGLRTSGLLRASAGGDASAGSAAPTTQVVVQTAPAEAPAPAPRPTA